MQSCCLTRTTSACHPHIIHTSKTCLSCLISCSTTPSDMHLSSAYHLHVVRMTLACHLHIICISKTYLSCLTSCSTTPGDMHTSSTHHPHLPELPNFMQYYTWQHAHIIQMSSAHPKLTELPNFMTCLVLICYVVSAGNSSQLVLMLSLIFG